MLKTLGTVFSASLICLGVATTSAFATPSADTASKGFSGNADWYADYYHGKKTASGALHDKTKFMAAHRTLPFGTKLLVINHRTGKECVVTVNDRGPYTANRVIDLSYAAAKHLGITCGSKMLEYKIVPKDTKVTELADLSKPSKAAEIATSLKQAEAATASKSAKTAEFATVAKLAKSVEVASAKPTKSITVATVAKSAPPPGAGNVAAADDSVSSALTTQIVPKASIKKEVALDPSTVED